MKILKYKKTKNDIYEIILENDKKIELYEDVILKNDLLINKSIDDKLLDKLIIQNDFEKIYYLCIKYINIKLRSELEIRNYLIKKDYSNNIIDEVVNKLKSNKLIDDNLYCKLFIKDEINLTSDGPNRIKDKLIKLGIKENIYQENICKIDENIFYDKINKLIDKELRLKKGSKNEVKLKIMTYLINLGYEKDMILNCIDKKEIKTDTDVLIKEYNKLIKRYEKKYSDKELVYFVLNKLYQKGYTKEEIENLK